MTGRLSLLLPATLCAALLCPPASAAASSASDTADSVKSRAQEQLARGIDAFRARRYKPAIDAFLAANELYPSAAISFNLARAYESMKDAPAALRFYRDYLRRAPNAPDAERIGQRVDGLEDELRARGVQQVSIYSTPAAATLVVDGRALGLTPWTGELAPGTHRLQLEREGYVTRQETFELAPHRALELDLPLALEPPPPPAPIAAELPPLPAPVQPPAGAMPRASGGEPVLPWIVLGGAGVALGGAVYFELASAGAEQDARNARTQVEALDHIGSMQGARTTARVLLGAGAALAVTGGVWLLLSGAEPEQPATLAVGCRGLSCDLRGAF